MEDPEVAWRDALLIQGFEGATRIPTWSTIRTQDQWKYTEYVTGEKQLYDLTADPFELTSRHADPAYQDIMTELADQLMQMNRGAAIKLDNLPNHHSNRLPDAEMGLPYSFQLSAWGGSGEYGWRAFLGDFPCTGMLPPGIAISKDGILSGTPTEAGIWDFCIKVADSSRSPQPGNPRSQEHIRQYRLLISSSTAEEKLASTDMLALSVFFEH
jgi:hypothetical protein